MRTAILAAVVASLAGCGWLDGGPDWLVAEAASPDGERVARLWCEDMCDITGRAALTVSPASRALPLEAGGSGFPPEGELPDADRVARFHADEEEPRWGLTWTAPGLVAIEGRCLARSRPARHGDIEIRFRDLERDCPAPVPRKDRQ